jgi:murein DD-endopeptidase MepM/ murein hydrolase activator NlpD
MRCLAAAVAIWMAQTPAPIGLSIQGLKLADVHDSFNAARNGHPHEAVDIMAPRGTAVRAVVSGTIAKLFDSKAGGNTVYEFDEAGAHSYYYAHLDHYAFSLRESMHVERGTIIAYVGSTGNADPRAPHLHFAIFKLGPKREWWKDTPIDPYRSLVDALKRGE